MAEAEHPPDPDELTCVVGGQEIQLIGIQAEVRRFEDAIHIELFHPLLVDLPPELAVDIVNAVIVTALGGRSPSIRVSVARSEQHPINPFSMAELRQLLSQLDS